MKDRIRLLMESQHMNQQSFASYIGLAPATLSSILQERTRPTLQTVDCISKKFPNINLGWLLYGSGEMFNSTGSVQSDSLDIDVVSPAESPVASASSQPTLDFAYEDSMPTSIPARQSSQRHLSTTVRQTQLPNVLDMKNIDKPNRKITEIRVYYDDQTWESFVPKK